MDIKNKLAIVTGASKGIGLATVKTLLDHGMWVAGWSRSLTNVSHPRLKSYHVDVSDPGSVERAWEKTVNDFEVPPLVLVNNAGLGFEAPLDKISMEHWHVMMNTNVNGIFYCTRLALPIMKKHQSGHIINISSIAGTTGVPNMVGYCATKHAVRGISSALYKEVRNHGIKVTCIYPGSVKTHFFDAIDSVTANDQMMMPEDIASTILHCLQASDNYHHVDIEVRPLRPKG